MDARLAAWAQEHKLVVNDTDSPDTVQVPDFGTLYLFKREDGAPLITGDFTFNLTDEQYEAIKPAIHNYILFEFGGKFYYSKLDRISVKGADDAYRPHFNDFKYVGKCAAPNTGFFTHLGIHDEYELLNGSASDDLWATKAAFLGYKTIGLSNVNTQASTLPFQTACQKHGLKPVIGETVTVARNYDPASDKLPETFELKLYVRTAQGYTNLLQINKAINVTYKGFIPDEELYALGEGLACVIPRNSEFNSVMDDRAAGIILLNRYCKNFDIVYYQIDTVEFSNQKTFKEHLQNINRYVVDWVCQLNPILINDSYYLDAEHAGLKELLNKVSGKVYPESATQYLKSESETFAAYAEWPELRLLIKQAMENADNMVEDIDFAIPIGDRRLPKFADNSDDIFFEEIQRGFEERIIGKVPDDKIDEYWARVDKECGVVVPAGLSDYFLILWDIMKFCRDNDIMVGPGRGSVCGSLIAFLLRITDVDPIRFNTSFERFLNETRVSGERAQSADSLPDIDFDVPTAHRDTVKNYVSRKYGIAYSCSIATFSRMRLKTCLKDFGRIKGVSYAEMNELTKDIDDQLQYKWEDLFEYAVKSKRLWDFTQRYPDIVHMTKFALDAPRAGSIHPSAIIIVPKHDKDGNDIDIYQWLPIKEIDGMLVSEWEGKYIDKAGFLKEDILGLSQLDKFINIFRLIKEKHGVVIDPLEIPLDDPEIFMYFGRGWTEDVFQFNTRGQQNYMREVTPTSFEDLCAMTALFRPGPMELGAHHDFAKFKRGEKTPEYDPLMEEVTKNTLSLFAYQEQVMAAAVVGGLTPVQSDIMRTTIKKKDFNTLNSFKEQFVQGYSQKIEDVVKNAEETANKVWDKLIAFAGYGFNRCISGDEIIRRIGHQKTGTSTFVPTVREMYRICNDVAYAKATGHRHLHGKYRNGGYGMCFSLQEERLKRNKIVDIRFAGNREIYRVTLSDGKTIDVTMNHKFPTPDGEKTLSELQVGDKLYVCAGYEETPINREIAIGGAGANFPRKGQMGFQKMEKPISKLERMFREANRAAPCDICGKTHRRMEIHHIDEHHSNFTDENIMWLCPSCHKKQHYRTIGRNSTGQKGLLTALEEITSIVFLKVGDTYDVEVSGDISHTFTTANGVVTSNSHSVAYTLMSYWGQWLKVHYPLEFWTTALTMERETKLPYFMAEMKRFKNGITVSTPDINKSHLQFTCDPADNAIYASLTGIKGVGDIAAQHIIETREKGRFFSFEEFCARVPSKVNRGVIEKLILAGAFDAVAELEEPRQRKGLLDELARLKGTKNDKYADPDFRHNGKWLALQKDLTGFGDVDYTALVKDDEDIPDRIKRKTVDGHAFHRCTALDHVGVAGKVVNFVEKTAQNGRNAGRNFGRGTLDCNGTMIDVVIWSDDWEGNHFVEKDFRDKILLFYGLVRDDTHLNKKALYSDGNRTYVKELKLNDRLTNDEKDNQSIQQL